MEQVKFIKPKDLLVIENENEYILRKGFLHSNEVTINKEKSSKEFNSSFSTFIQENSIILNKNDKVYEDFHQLVQFRLIDLKSNEKIVVIANSKIFEGKDKILFDNIILMEKDDVLSHVDVVKINENKDPVTLNEIYSKYGELFKDYDGIYYIDDLRNITSLRAINRITAELNIELTLGFYDNDNVYLTKIKHGYTGCFECMEKHIISKFPNDMNYYMNRDSKCTSYNSNDPSIMFLLSILTVDIQNVLVYGSSSLLGQVIHFYLPSFEYSYNSNRRYISCPTCGGINKTIFEEQNVRSVNLIKEAMRDDSI